MDAHAMRILISGAVGGLLTVWVLSHFSRHIPKSVNGKRSEDLLAEYRLHVVAAKFFFFGGIAAGIVAFQAGWISRTSWAHFGIMLGLSSLGAVLGLWVPTVLRKRGNIREAIAALAITDRAPVLIFVLMFVLSMIGFSASLVHVLYGWLN